MMRVAITVEQSWQVAPSGIGTSTVELLRALAARDDLEIVGVAAMHRRPPAEDWRLPVPVEHLPVPSLPLMEAWHKLRWPPVELATGRVDVVHGTTIAVPASRAPLVHTIHDLAFRSYPGHFTRRGVRFFRRSSELARRHARLITCPSLATMDECAAAGFDRDRLRLVPWGVRIEPARPEDVAGARRRYELDRPYVLFCGMTKPGKNLARVIEAFRRLDHSDLEIVFVGPAGYEGNLRPLLGGLGGRARWLGSVRHRELAPLYAGATVFVSPSLTEGFGLPVLEAMAQGTPVVTSERTATREVAGDAALLVDPLDVDAISDAIERIIEDDRLAGRLAEAGKRRASMYSWERTADLMAAVYEEVAGSSP